MFLKTDDSFVIIIDPEAIVLDVTDESDAGFACKFYGKTCGDGCGGEDGHADADNLEQDFRGDATGGDDEFVIHGDVVQKTLAADHVDGVVTPYIFSEKQHFVWGAQRGIVTTARGVVQGGTFVQLLCQCENLFRSDFDITIYTTFRNRGRIASEVSAFATTGGDGAF